MRKLIISLLMLIAATPALADPLSATEISDRIHGVWALSPADAGKKTPYGKSIEVFDPLGVYYIFAESDREPACAKNLESAKTMANYGIIGDTIFSSETLPGPPKNGRMRVKQAEEKVLSIDDKQMTLQYKGATYTRLKIDCYGGGDE